MDLRKYIYNNGYTKRYHVCGQCGSKAMREDPVGSFQASQWLCMDCGSVEIAPEWENLKEPINTIEDEPSEAWISIEDQREMALNQALNLN